MISSPFGVFSVYALFDRAAGILFQATVSGENVTTLRALVQFPTGQ